MALKGPSTTMTYKTLKGYTYVVTASEAVTITDSNGLVLEVPAGEQRPFTATTTEVTYSAPCTITQVRGNFSLPPAGGGGGQIVIDPTPTQGSPNAVSSDGVWTALQNVSSDGDPIVPVAAVEGAAALVVAHGKVFDVATEATSLAVTAAQWGDKFVSCTVRWTPSADVTSPVDNSTAITGVAWVAGAPVIVSGYTYLLGLTQVSATLVLCSLLATYQED